MADDARARITRRRFLGGSVGAAAAAALPWTRTGSSAMAATGCDPLSTPKHFRGLVPTPKEVLGFELGVKREVTSQESRKLVRALAHASDRVVTGVYGRSVLGRPLQYAIAGKPENVSDAGLARIRSATEMIRDPHTSPAKAAELAGTTPGIAWLIANVHGGEESGADADLQILYELADRDDCVVDEILENTIVLIIPVQNPDGRVADTRRNAYGFDLNRDLFARTQPETDGKVELMRQYPPIVLIDSHEFGYYSSFFPPNNDPWYHEVSSQTTTWINDVFGRAFSNAYKRENFAFFHGKVYDFFSPEYNDTVSTNGFQAAGMTIECNQDRPLSQRFARHYTVDIVAAHRAALDKTEILRGQNAAYRRAVEEGQHGVLEPNRRIFHPRKPVHEQVPDRLVRHYFIERNPGKQWEVSRLLRRLQRMDVEVFRLTEDLRVPDYRPYARAPRTTTLPKGSYWIPMAQAQKHWIQMLLNEDSYLPTLFTFGLSGWSNPLLMNVDGGSSGARLKPQAQLLAPVSDGLGTVPSNGVRVGVYRMSNGSFADESVGSTRWLFRTEWNLPFTDLSAEDIAHGKLRNIDVLVVPGGGSKPAVKRLGNRGAEELRRFVNRGGRYIGYRGGGTRLAAEIGLSTVLLSRVKVDIPGSLVRAAVDEHSPLAKNVGPFVWVLFDDDFVMRTQGGYAPIRYPTGKSGDFFVSGFSRYEENIYGTAAVADEAVGSGRVIVFGADPTYQGSTEGTERILLNAILGPDPTRSDYWFGYGPRESHAPAGSPERARAEEAARRAAAALPDWSATMSLVVRAGDAGTASRLLRGFSARFSTERDGSEVRFAIENPRELSVEEHPWALALVIELRKAGIEPLNFRVR